MPSIISSLTERTTAATDLLLCLLAIAAVLYLGKIKQSDGWRIRIWQLTFALMALSALLGATAHGLVWTDTQMAAQWLLIDLLLALMVSLFTLACVTDCKSAGTAKKLSPALCVFALVFWLGKSAFAGGFTVFVLFAASAMLVALMGYSYSALVSNSEKKSHCAGVSAIGIALMIIGIAIQATKAASFTLIWPFDHNGVFHLIQATALPILVWGITMKQPE
jgi:hypothetical protein